MRPGGRFPPALLFQASRVHNVPMDTADRIRKLGFRKWHERELLKGHGYLAICFLGFIMVTASLEVYARRESLLWLVMALALGLIGGWVSLTGWAYYRRIMVVTGHVSDHAVCARCEASGKFDVLSAEPALQQPEEPGTVTADNREGWMKVRCRKCGNEWTI